MKLRRKGKMEKKLENKRKIRKQKWLSLFSLFKLGYLYSLLVHHPNNPA